MMNISDSDMNEILELLFITKSKRPERLQRPSMTVDSYYRSKLDLITMEDEFRNLGIGVVDFTDSLSEPGVWFHNENAVYRMYSMGKLAILLAAVQLRDDVRRVKATGKIQTKDFDDLFTKIWRHARKDNKPNLSLMNSNKLPPRISTVFDIDIDIPDFIGADVWNVTAGDQWNPSDRAAIMDKRKPYHEIEWGKTAPNFSFYERMWLAGAWSDNHAATSCISEIGQDYIVAVQEAYGLYDESAPMVMRLAIGYPGSSDIGGHVNLRSNSLEYRKLPPPDYKPFSSLAGYRSPMPGSAIALTAYMIALMQGRLAGPEGSATIRNFLGDETYLDPPTNPNRTLGSFILNGVSNLERVKKAYTKIGLGGPNPPYEPNFLINEFTYVEAGDLKYGVVAMGIYGDPGIAIRLAERVHKALSRP